MVIQRNDRSEAGGRIKTMTMLNAGLRGWALGLPEIENTIEGGIKITFIDEDEFGHIERIIVTIEAEDLQILDRLRSIGIL